jgi:hypothetical protein
VSLADPEAEEERVRELYEGLLSARGIGAAAGPEIPLERFRSYLIRQTSSLRNKYHCERVTFILEVGDTAVRF